MASFVLMPQKGLREESAILSEWHVKKGDKVNVGDILFDIETGKAMFPVESEVSGTVLETIGEPGDEIHIQECVMVIGEEGESYEIPKREGAEEEAAEVKAEEVKAEAPVETKAAEVKAEAPKAAPVAAPAAKKDASGRIFASPIVRKMAKEQGIDLSAIAGTGPNGRIIRADFEKFVASGAAVKAAPVQEDAGLETLTGPFRDEKFTHMRKVIAKRMYESLQNSAQLTNSTSFDATNIIEYRKALVAAMDDLGLTKITYNDIILYAVSRVLKNHPVLNAHIVDGKVIRYFENVNLGMAVDTPKGLMVPTIFGADKLSLNEISLQAKVLAAKCKNGTITPDELSGGSFTVSNIGSLGIESFTPVINSPQTGILGVCNMQTKLKMEGDEAVPYQAMGLSLTYDHRAVDGSPASRFLKELCGVLENFSLLLAK